MANLTPSQRATQARFEGVIALAAPFLDVVLGVGERISRIAEPTDHEYYPIRSGGRVALPGEPGYVEGNELPLEEPAASDAEGAEPAAEPPE